MTSEGEEIRTIFVTGFPPDAKEREVQNMLRWWPGYEACQLTFKGDQPLGFAIFSTPAMAFAARDALQGLIFDADHNSVLRVELAKTNLHRRKGLPGGGDGYDHSKRSRVDPMAAYMPGAAAAAAMGSFMPAAYDAYASSFTPLPAAAPPAAPKTYTPLPAPPSGMPGKIYRDNPPCNTLYLGNLGPGVSEAELLQIFSVQPGSISSAHGTAKQGITLASSFPHLLSLPLRSPPVSSSLHPLPPLSHPLFTRTLRRGGGISSAHCPTGNHCRFLFASLNPLFPLHSHPLLFMPFSLPALHQDVEAASAVHTALQGIILAPSLPHSTRSVPSVPLLFMPFSLPALHQDVEAASAVHTALQGIILAPSLPHSTRSVPSVPLLFMPFSLPALHQDVEAASAVHTALQGISLASSDRGPVRVQYPPHHHSPTALTHSLPGPMSSCPPFTSTCLCSLPPYISLPLISFSPFLLHSPLTLCTSFYRLTFFSALPISFSWLLLTPIRSPLTLCT
ncbi:unnamed protein product [Closterium sp. NIES-64]|nr:unnamed protein product [Closterium sp. NIES-64]